MSQITKLTKFAIISTSLIAALPVWAADRHGSAGSDNTLRQQEEVRQKDVSDFSQRTDNPNAPGGESDMRARMDWSSVSSDDADDAREVLAAVTSEIVTGDFEDVVGYLIKEDRERIGELSDQQLRSFKQAAEQTEAEWQEKYNQDFDLASTDQREQAFDLKVYKENDGTLIMNAPAAEGMQEARVHLKREGLLNTLRIDIPDSMSGQQLANNLADQLESAQRSFASNKVEASKALTRGVAYALSGNAATKGQS